MEGDVISGTPTPTYLGTREKEMGTWIPYEVQMGGSRDGDKGTGQDHVATCMYRTKSGKRDSLVTKTPHRAVTRVR